MRSKRGEGPGGWFWAVLGAIISFVIIGDIISGEFSLIPSKAFFELTPTGFENVFLVRGKQVDLTFLNYIFGKIPGHLIEITENNVGAGIIIIAIWLVFFLVFADIMKLYGGFSAAVNWVVAGLLAIIGANLKVISWITVYFLSVLAVFGSLSILFSLIAIFVLFLVFHFGTSKFREWVIMRRAEDSAIRAVAGGKKAASGIQVLKDIATQAEEK